MSYIRADEVLPRDLLETVQQYVEGKLIYIPSREKQEWGSATSTRAVMRARNKEIFDARQAGVSVEELWRRFSLSEKSIQRIVREQRLAANRNNAIP